MLGKRLVVIIIDFFRGARTRNKACYLDRERICLVKDQGVCLSSNFL